LGFWRFLDMWAYFQIRKIITYYFFKYFFCIHHLPSFEVILQFSDVLFIFLPLLVLDISDMCVYVSLALL
jgi:hypothetical protein